MTPSELSAIAARADAAMAARWPLDWIDGDRRLTGWRGDVTDTTARTCLDCEFWGYSPGSPSYSEYTPGSDASMVCYLDHWSLGLYENDRGDVRDALYRARQCQDFKPEAP